MSLGDSYVAIEASHGQSPMFELMMVFLIEARVEIQMLCWQEKSKEKASHPIPIFETPSRQRKTALTTER